MFHPGWVSGLKVKAHWEGPDPPGCGRPSTGTVCPWNRDQQGSVQMKSVCCDLSLTSSGESCQQKQPCIEHL